MKNTHAFPVPDTYYPNGQVQYGTPGMTMLDYFAAKAMQSAMANPKAISILSKKTGARPQDMVATISYDMAQAMIDEKHRREA